MVQLDLGLGFTEIGVSWGPNGPRESQPTLNPHH